MKKITVPSFEEVSSESQVMFEQMKKRIGKVPNLYATIGYSSHALKAFLDFEGTLNQGVFNAKEREAIALIVSEINHCEYCLAGHTVAAMRNGLSMEDTLRIRRGAIDDTRMDTVIKLAKSVTETHGHPEDQYLEKFYEAGFNEGALMELIGLVTVRVFTNYVFATTNIPVDFPIAPALS